MTITDIKDNSPNPILVERLKLMLAQAESGELRSLFYVCGFDDDGVGHSWSMDRRTTRYRFLGAVTAGISDFTINRLAGQQDSAFVSILESLDN